MGGFYLFKIRSLNALKVPKVAIVCTNRALSYAQLRMALFFLRDVQDSDDIRDF